MSYFEHCAGARYQSYTRDVMDFVPVPLPEIEIGIEVKEYATVGDYMREINRK